MYLAMARVAHREGYPEIGLYWEKAAWEEAEHAAKFAEHMARRSRRMCGKIQGEERLAGRGAIIMSFKPNI